MVFSVYGAETLNSSENTSVVLHLKQSCYRWLLLSGNIIGLLALHPHYFKGLK